MQRPVRAVLLAIALVSVAGCLEQPDPVADGGMHVAGGAAGAAHPHMAMNGTPAPQWHIGQSWTHKWTLVGGDGGENFTFLVRTVVAEKAGDGWILATDNQTIAAFHGAFIIPTLGHVSRDLVQTAGETRFPWYHFPLTATSAWRDTFVGWDGSKAIPMEVEGRVTGVSHSPAHAYHVEMASEGQVVATYDYDVETQWFREARFYGSGGELQFLVQMVETHPTFKGRLYDTTNGKLLLTHASFLVPTAGLVEPSPPSEFTMDASMNRLLVFLFSFAVAGGHDSELIAPDGTRHGAQALDAMLFPIHNDSRIAVLPGQAGTWRAVAAGAGVASGGFIQAFGMTERVIDL